jgi:hypothetical protein
LNPSCACRKNELARIYVAFADDALRRFNLPYAADSARFGEGTTTLDVAMTGRH